MEQKIIGLYDDYIKGLLDRREFLKRLAVLAGGIIMNLILPFILLAAAYMAPHNIVVGEIVVQEVHTGSPAAMAGIRPGDTITGTKSPMPLTPA